MSALGRSRMEWWRLCVSLTCRIVTPPRTFSPRRVAFSVAFSAAASAMRHRIQWAMAGEATTT